MPLTLRCPKCETSVREGTRRCPLCTTPLRSGLGSEPREETGAPILDPLLELFSRDEMLRACPWCRNEFTHDAKRCKPCGSVVVPLARSKYAAGLTGRPIGDRGRVIKAGPAIPARELRRVKTCVDADDAAVLLDEFRAYGVDAWAGTDAMEPYADAEPVGVWIRDADLTAADYLISGVRVSRKPPPVDPDRRTGDLRRARIYLSFGRWRRAVLLAGAYPGDVEAEELVVEAMLGAGRVRDADRRAEAAHATEPKAAARLKLLGGVTAALGNDGVPFGPGGDLVAAESRLRTATALQPRFLDAGKALVEVLIGAKRPQAAAEELRRITRLNPNLCAQDGWFRTQSSTLPRTG